jgi:hypothetical protein
VFPIHGRVRLLTPVLYTSDYPHRFGGEPVILRGFPQHAPQDEKLQLLPRSTVSRRLRVPGHIATGVAEQ